MEMIVDTDTMLETIEHLRKSIEKSMGGEFTIEEETMFALLGMIHLQLKQYTWLNVPLTDGFKKEFVKDVLTILQTIKEI